MSYYYQSPESLKFEQNMRKGIIDSAKALKASGVDFATYKSTRCNKKFWSRTGNGGILLKKGVLPSVGIVDIFQNGHLYAFECSAAMVIVLYKATLDAIGADIFNAYFKDMFLWDWNVDSDLRLITTYYKNEMTPGDIVYFKNPDHAPDKQEWQGENAVMFADDLYYGHGIGITTAAGIIASLNKERIPGSVSSAYLTDQALHPDFEYLRRLSLGRSQPVVDHRQSENAVFARIGAGRYIHKITV
ncbi:protein-glutamine gamma-glutamyltransferase [Paenibacillus sp. BR2-3]|uniref:protein-glutamine gamma-glutamyltransferase n=1 Tax=Paenibacillus sp. BR2-3 TaxID=3048494 RepID=UPI00397763DA